MQDFLLLWQGEVIVSRERAGDASMLRAVRNCEYSYEKVMDMANTLLAEMNSHYQTSALPKSVNKKAMSEFCEELIELQGFS